MRHHYLAAASLLSLAAPVAAADQLAFGPVPSWVAATAIPPIPASADDQPVRVLLNDQQVRLDPGQSTKYSDVALALRTAQGLSAGGISFSWNPQTDTVTVNRLLIHRGKAVIDVLKAGQTFTVVRREPNLESSTLDGMLTASLQPEDLQVGDVVELAVTTVTRDPVLKGHFEDGLALWNGVPLDRGHASIIWPQGMNVRARSIDGTALPAITKADGYNRLELSARNLEPIMPPKGAPARFGLGRGLELTDFAGWSDVADLMAPLYRTASVIPASGPLRIEADKIAAASADPVKRAELALQLVQDRVRYVALLMGQGSYVPATATESWARRFGDCKAKTALLLALLHELKIDAEPMLANFVDGDGIDQRLPMLALFNHVLVRARIAGKTYYLDGTRQGDASLARLAIAPDDSWALPVVANAALIRLVRPPLAEPSLDAVARIDASAGLEIPAPTHLEATLRGDGAITMNQFTAMVSGAQRIEMFGAFWKELFADLTVVTATSSFDKATGELHLVADGTIKMDWSRGRYWLSSDDVGYKPDFDRLAGPMADAPFAISHPVYNRIKQTIRLPKDFDSSLSYVFDPIDARVGGYEYHRSGSHKGGVATVVTSRRSLGGELSYRQALADSAQLNTLNKDNLTLRIGADYALTDSAVVVSLANKPKSPAEAKERVRLLMQMAAEPDALRLLNDLVRDNPGDMGALTARGMALFGKRDLDGAARDWRAVQAVDHQSTHAAGCQQRLEDLEVLQVAQHALPLVGQQRGAHLGLVVEGGERAGGVVGVPGEGVEGGVHPGQRRPAAGSLRCFSHPLQGRRRCTRPRTPTTPPSRRWA